MGFDQAIHLTKDAFDKRMDAPAYAATLHRRNEHLIQT
jgi:hypothetical protein